MTTDTPKCELCGDSMPAGEEMFKYHGYSGPCPRPLLPKSDTSFTEAHEHNVGSVSEPHYVVDSKHVERIEGRLKAVQEERDMALEWLWNHVKEIDRYILPSGEEEDCPLLIKEFIEKQK